MGGVGHFDRDVLHVQQAAEAEDVDRSDGNASGHVPATVTVLVLSASLLQHLLPCARISKYPRYLSVKALHMYSEQQMSQLLISEGYRMYSEQQMSQLLVSEGSTYVLGTSNVPATCVRH